VDRHLRLLVVVLVLLAVPSRAFALPTIADGDFRIDLPSDEQKWCIVVPESLTRPEDCSGVELAAARQRVAKPGKGGAKVVAFAMVVGGDFESVGLTRVDDLRTELDTTEARAVVQGIRKRLDPSQEADPINTRDHWEERVNGVQIIGLEMVIDVPTGNGQTTRMPSVLYAATTGGGGYLIQLMASPSRVDAMKAHGGQMLSTLHATPAKKHSDLAVTRAGAIGDMISHGLQAIIELVGVVVVGFFIVRHLRQRKKRPG
jgi:hypothetical protein